MFAKESTLMTDSLTFLLKHFFIDNKLDKENFRTYILDIFKSVQANLDEIYRNPSFSFLLTRLNDHCVVTNNPACQKAIAEIKDLPTRLTNWLKDSVEDSSRFEIFVILKAGELSSGDKDYDYYYALMIRHDQLLAACSIFRQSLANIQSIFKVEDPKNIINDPAFTYFADYTFDEKIYLTAQNIFDARKKMGII